MSRIRITYITEEDFEKHIDDLDRAPRRTCTYDHYEFLTDAIDEFRRIFPRHKITLAEYVDVEKKGDHTMRNYTVITSDYGNKPSAGYVSDIIKMVSDRDGWYTLDFLGELKPLFNAIDDEDGEIYFMIECPEDVFDFNWKFFGSESEFCHFISDRVVPYGMRFFRYFTHKQNAGLEELEEL